MVKISIITALGRPEWKYLEKAHQSVVALAQALEDLCEVEWLWACDGVEKDEAVAQLKEWAKPNASGPSVKILPGFKKDNRLLSTSAGDARNRALAVATGEYLLTLDHDDYYLPEMEELVRRCIADDNLWRAGLAVDVDEAGNSLPSPPSYLQSGEQAKNSFYQHYLEHQLWPFHPSSTIAKTRVVKECGGWEGQGFLRDDEDTFLWATISRNYFGVFEKLPVMAYRRHEASLTHSADYNMQVQDFEKVWREREAQA